MFQVLKKRIVLPFHNYSRPVLSDGELTFWLSELASLLKSRLPIAQSVKLLAESEHARVARFSQKIYKDLYAGCTLEQAFSVHYNREDGMVESLITAGEASGGLAECIQTAVDCRQVREREKKELQSMLIYPSLVLGFAFCLLIGLLVGLVPKFEYLLTQQLGSERLPLMTRSLIGLSHYVQDNWLSLGFSLVGFGVSLRVYSKKPRWQRRVGRLLKRLPLWSKFYFERQTGLFCYTLGILLTRHVGIAKAFPYAIKVLPRGGFAEQLDPALGFLLSGNTLASSLKKNPDIGKRTLNVIHYGESRGQLNDTLVAHGQELLERSQVRVKLMFRYLEPLLIVLIAALVGVIVLALFLPLMQVLQSIHVF